MSGRPAPARARDYKQLILGARRAGDTKVEFMVGAVPAIVHLSSDQDAHIDADSNNSFDKIMQDE